MIYLYLFGTCFHFIYVFMIIGNKLSVYDLISLAVIIVVADLRNAFMSMPD